MTKIVQMILKLKGGLIGCLARLVHIFNFRPTMNIQNYHQRYNELCKESGYWKRRTQMRKRFLSESPIQTRKQFSMAMNFLTSDLILFLGLGKIYSTRLRLFLFRQTLGLKLRVLSFLFPSVNIQDHTRNEGSEE